VGDAFRSITKVRTYANFTVTSSSKGPPPGDGLLLTYAFNLRSVAENDFDLPVVFCKSGVRDAIMELKVATAIDSTEKVIVGETPMP
jgi:hypothetical protein